jgi:hypothetical protein
VTSSLSGAEIDVALAAAHLGAAGCTHDESAQLGIKSCAALPPDAPRGTGMCGGPCDFSKIQLSFTPSGGNATAHVKITKVAILDSVSGAELQSLTAYTPLVWNGAQYVPWDESIPSGAPLKASYTLSPPTWNWPAAADATSSGPYSRQYRVRVELTIDGAPATLQSEPVSQAPVVAT